jgi:peptidyl-prolyl cis-trans isomerase D
MPASPSASPCRRAQSAAGGAAGRRDEDLQLGATKLPAYAGAVNESGGYSIFKVAKVIEPPAPEPAKLAAATTRVSEQIGRELFTAYLASLKAGADVKINPSALEKK